MILYLSISPSSTIIFCFIYSQVFCYMHNGSRLLHIVFFFYPLPEPFSSALLEREEGREEGRERNTGAREASIGAFLHTQTRDSHRNRGSCMPILGVTRTCARTGGERTT